MLVCLESPEMQIIVLWVTQFVTPSFVRLTPEDRKVLALVRDIRLGELPATVVMLPEWLTPSEVEVLLEANMEAALERLPPGTPRLPADTPRPERV